jgi:hypothetical protein
VELPSAPSHFSDWRIVTGGDGEKGERCVACYPTSQGFLGFWHYVEIARAVRANLRSVLVHIRRRRPSFQEEGGGDAVFDSNPFGFIYDEARSRCEQYGGHWKGHKCVGIPRHKDQGPEVVKNICIFDWWNPVGWVCGAAAAGKAAYEAANK